MADQIFSTIQIPVNQWRWLPVSCIDSTGAGVTDPAVAANQIDVSFIRYGELSTTAYSDVMGFDHTTTPLVGNYAIGVSTIKLFDSTIRF